MSQAAASCSRCRWSYSSRSRAAAAALNAALMSCCVSQASRTLCGSPCGHRPLLGDMMELPSWGPGAGACGRCRPGVAGWRRCAHWSARLAFGLAKPGCLRRGSLGGPDGPLDLAVAEPGRFGGAGELAEEVRAPGVEGPVCGPEQSGVAVAVFL